MEACRQAQLGWLVDFTSSAVSDHVPREGEQAEPPEKCLVREDCLDDLKLLATAAIQTAATNGQLILHSRLPEILYRWRDFSDEEGAPVRVWTTEQLEDDLAIARLATAFTSKSWTQGIGDKVALRHVRAAVDGLESIVDVQSFRQRLENLAAGGTLDSPHKENIEAFIRAWRERDDRPD